MEPILDNIQENFKFFLERDKKEKGKGIVRRNDETKEEETLDNKEEDIIGQIQILASRKIIQISRKYKKFPSFIADLTSILEEVMIIFLVFINIFGRKAIEHKLISKMFKFNGSEYFNIDCIKNKFSKIKEIPTIQIKKEDPKKIGNESEKSNSSFRKTNIKNHRNRPRLLKFRMENNNNYLKKKSSKSKELYHKENNSLGNNFQSIITTNDCFEKNQKCFYFNYNKMNLCSIMFNFYCSCWSKLEKIKRKALEKIEKKINYYLDVYKYIQTLQEVELIKKCFFDYNEGLLFNFLSKPSFKIGYKTEEILEKFREDISLNEYNNEEQIEVLFSAYENINKKNDKSFSEESLIQLLDLEIDFL